MGINKFFCLCQWICLDGRNLARIIINTTLHLRKDMKMRTETVQRLPDIALTRKTFGGPRTRPRGRPAALTRWTRLLIKKFNFCSIFCFIELDPFSLDLSLSQFSDSRSFVLRETTLKFRPQSDVDQTSSFHVRLRLRIFARRLARHLGVIYSLPYLSRSLHTSSKSGSFWGRWGVKKKWISVMASVNLIST